MNSLRKNSRKGINISDLKKLLKKDEKKTKSIRVRNTRKEQPRSKVVLKVEGKDPSSNSEQLMKDFINEEKDYVFENTMYNRGIFNEHFEDFIKKYPYFSARYKKYQQNDMFSKIVEDTSKIIEEQHKLMKLHGEIETQSQKIVKKRMTELDKVQDLLDKYKASGRQETFDTAEKIIKEVSIGINRMKPENVPVDLRKKYNEILELYTNFKKINTFIHEASPVFTLYENVTKLKDLHNNWLVQADKFVTEADHILVKYDNLTKEQKDLISDDEKDKIARIKIGSHEIQDIIKEYLKYREEVNNILHLLNNSRTTMSLTDITENLDKALYLLKEIEKIKYIGDVMSSSLNDELRKSQVKRVEVYQNNFEYYNNRVAKEKKDEEDRKKIQMQEELTRKRRAEIEALNQSVIDGMLLVRKSAVKSLPENASKSDIKNVVEPAVSALVSSISKASSTSSTDKKSIYRTHKEEGKLPYEFIKSELEFWSFISAYSHDKNIQRYKGESDQAFARRVVNEARRNGIGSTAVPSTPIRPLSPVV